jgi:hypothetical protein
MAVPHQPPAQRRRLVRTSDGSERRMAHDPQTRHHGGYHGADRQPPDVVGWGQAIAGGHLRHMRLEAIVAAIQDLGPLADKRVLNPLAARLSDATLRILRAKVGHNHRNDGLDIIERVHDQIIQAVLRPKSADGKSLRLAFIPRVEFRLIDAIAAEARANRIPTDAKPEKNIKGTKAEDVTELAGSASGDHERPAPSDATDTSDDEDADPANLNRESATLPGAADPTDTLEGEDAGTSSLIRDYSLMDGVRDLDEMLDVETVLANILDDRKRLAFRLYMDEIPFKSKRSISIASALGISEKTARDWIEEIQEILKTKVGARHD